MKKVIKHMDLITQHRDRALLEVSVATAIYEVARAACVRISRLLTFGADALVAVTTLVDGSGVYYEENEAQSVESAHPLQDNPFMMAVASTHAPVVRQDAASGLYHHVLPLVVGGEVIGFVEIEEKHKPFRHEDDLASGFLALYRNYLNLLDYSEKDSLTGLLNRKTFDDNLEKIVGSGHSPGDCRLRLKNLPLRREEPRQGSHQWLAMVDVDLFKQVNDRFGHLYGDEVLLLIARTMKQSFRQHDSLFRVGGEEFVVLLRPTEFDNARRILERFRAAVERLDIPTVGRVTVSIGFTRIEDEDVPTAVLGRADEAVYHAKHTGRNRVCFWEELAEAGGVQKKEISPRADSFSHRSAAADR